MMPLVMRHEDKGILQTTAVMISKDLNMCPVWEAVMTATFYESLQNSQA